MGQPAAPLLPVTARVGAVRATQGLCPRSFYQRHGRAWTLGAGEGHVQYLEGLLGQWEG